MVIAFSWHYAVILYLAEFTCAGKPDGDYADPTKMCSQNWYTCAHGITYPHTCPPNTVFDPDEDQCVWSYQYPPCAGSTTTRRTTLLSTAGTTSKPSNCCNPSLNI